MEKERKTVTERMFGQTADFAQIYGRTDAQEEEVEEVGKPKSRSANSFLDSLTSNDA